ncbi:hypothetical protein EYC54_22050 [Xanthomonas oryzae]|nr:hypothetical protein EYC54_22050 [Xanthomonas oryzae]
MGWVSGIGYRVSGIGYRESGIGNRESGIGNRESQEHPGAWGAMQDCSTAGCPRQPEMMQMRRTHPSATGAASQRYPLACRFLANRAHLWQSTDNTAQHRASIHLHQCNTSANQRIGTSPAPKAVSMRTKSHFGPTLTSGKSPTAT